ncbi:MAG: hypothetical protein ACHQ4H_14540, partial [Ktedonobacterales bacterium]
MRDRARHRAYAQAKSRHADPEDLKEAAQRVKVIEQEMREMELRPETRHGEERSQRYGRLLRLRSMREGFTAARPLEQRNPLNSVAISLVMLVASVALCAFCVGGAYTGILFLHQKPDPIATASAFWDTMETQKYSDVVLSYLSPTLRVQYGNGLFENAARGTDTGYGNITNAQLLSQAGDLTRTANLTYLVTRNATYKVTLMLTLHGGSWGVDDLGNTLTPDKAGLPVPTATALPTGSPSSSPSA